MSHFMIHLELQATVFPFALPRTVRLHWNKCPFFNRTLLVSNILDHDETKHHVPLLDLPYSTGYYDHDQHDWPDHTSCDVSEDHSGNPHKPRDQVGRLALIDVQHQSFGPRCPDWGPTSTRGSRTS